MDKKELLLTIILGVLLGIIGTLLLVKIESIFKKTINQYQQSIVMMISDMCGDEH